MTARDAQVPPIQTILLVEDEVLIRLHIARYLRDCGFNVIEAIDAEEALQVLQSEHGVDLVVSDVELSGPMDGFGLAQWVRSNKKGVKVVLAGTPERAASTAAELCEEGPTLAKPYDPQILADLIRRHLAIGRKEDES